MPEHFNDIQKPELEFLDNRKFIPEANISFEEAKKIYDKYFDNTFTPHIHSKLEEGMTKEKKEILDKEFNSKYFEIKDDSDYKKNIEQNLNKENIIEKNREEGKAREVQVYDELKKQYPEKDGYYIEREVYLRDRDGNIVKDPVTGKTRRIDFVVIKDGKVADSIEVTSKTADKSKQIDKEDRIRQSGGNFIKDSNRNLVEIPSTVKTRIERRD